MTLKQRRNLRKRVDKVVIPRVLLKTRQAIHRYRHRHLFKLNKLINVNVVKRNLHKMQINPEAIPWE